MSAAIPWAVIQSPTDAEMSAVQGAYLVADNLPLEDACMIAAAPGLLIAARKALNFIENTESELGITLDSGDALRAAIAKTTVQS